MLPLSRRVKESIKPALAFVIIYAISLYKGWERPYWATVNLLSTGLTLYRGLVRVLATRHRAMPYLNPTIAETP